MTLEELTHRVESEIGPGTDRTIREMAARRKVELTTESYVNLLQEEGEFSLLAAGNDQRELADVARYFRNLLTFLHRLPTVHRQPRWVLSAEAA